MFTDDGFGLERSVLFLIMFFHAIGNLYVVWDPGISMSTDISTPVCNEQGSVRSASFVRCPTSRCMSVAFPHTKVFDVSCLLLRMIIDQVGNRH